MSRAPKLWAAFARPESRASRALGYVLLAASCLPPLCVSHLPLRELPQYAALARMLVHLHDPRYGFDAYYALAPLRGASVLPLWLWGLLADAVGLSLATRLVVCLSVALGLSGLCAVLRAQDKPALLALLGVPGAYASSFYLGLVPSSLSAGLALWVIAGCLCPRPGRALQLGLWLACCALPLIHPLGVVLVLGFALCSVITQGRSWRQAPYARWPLAPLLPGALYWLYAARHADGVASFNQPGLAFRLLRAPEWLIGGFEGQLEAWRLTATLVVWLYLCRPLWLRRRRPLTPLTAACWAFAALCLLGYLFLPSSTWTTTAIAQRAGATLLGFLPALVPRAGLRLARQRGPLLLAALALWTVWAVGAQLARFSAEASALDRVLARVPARPKLLCLTYDNQGQLARSSPYLHIGAYAQAERGGFLALSRLDYAWTTPLRRSPASRAPAPVYGSEWEPALLHAQPQLLRFYDTILVVGKEPREMTILMNTPFELAARSGMFLLYTRAH